MSSTATAPTRTAMVTGASRGIGKTIATMLASKGYYVYLNYASSESKAQEVLSEIVAAGGHGELCRFDVSNSAEVETRFSEIAKSRGPLSVLVNNAGINADGLLVRMKDEDLSRVIDIDLKGAIYCTREAAKQMMRARAGSIVQVSSVIGEMGNPGQSAYAAAKAGLIGFAKSAAKELASRNIRVNVVTPGFIETEMTEVLTDAQKEVILRNIPLGFLGKAEDVAALVTFLSGPESRYVTGQVFGVNGGLYI